MNRRSERRSSLSITSAVMAALGLLFATFAVPACRDNGSSPTAPEKAKASEGHEHGDGHDHGEAEHNGEVKLTADAIARYGVKVEAVSLYKLQPTFVAPARVAFNAEAMAHVGTPLPGRAIELRARLGDAVKKGDVLLVVESPELGEAQSEYLVKQIFAQTAVSAVELAESALERAKGLYEENRAIALDEVKRREGEHKAAQAALMSAKAAATAAENKLHLLGMEQTTINKLRETSEVNPRFSIVAPIDGEVVEREVKQGELVSREKESLFVLADLDILWVLADVPEARLPQVVLGAKAWINPGSLDPHKHEGQVSYIAPQIDPRTRTGAVRIAVKCEHGALRPGAFVQVEISATDRADSDPLPVVAIPEEAVQTIDGQNVVFVPVANEENTFAKRVVTIGRAVGGLTPILSGLVEGEHAVSAGSFILKADLGKGSAEHEH